MSTIKLKKPTGATPAAATERRGPLRPGGVKRPRPTVAQAQAERHERAARTEPPTRRAGPDERPPHDPRPKRTAPTPAPAGTARPTPTRSRAAGAAPRPDADRRRPTAADPTAPTRGRAGLQRPDRADPGPVALRTPAPAEPAAAALPRLSKRLSELGLASRREADEWIAQGFVRVDGAVVDQLGARVHPSQRIEIDPAARAQQAQRVTVLLHKPLGVVSGQAEDGHAPASTLVRADTRWTGDHAAQRFHPGQLKHLVPAGRLDLDSTGLLVLTQDGRIAKQLIGEDSKVEKEYVVRVRWPEQPDAPALNAVFPAERLDQLRHGLKLDGEALKPAKVSWQSEHSLRFVLREGKKRQIRRMCELVGLQVVALKRIRIGRIGLGELPPGQWRYLGPFESFL